MEELQRYITGESLVQAQGSLENQEIHYQIVYYTLAMKVQVLVSGRSPVQITAENVQLARCLIVPLACWDLIAPYLQDAVVVPLQNIIPLPKLVKV